MARSLDSPLQIQASSTPGTLRYSERVGLVRVPRDEQGRRRYDPASARQRGFITRMRTSGMRVTGLKHYVDLFDAGE